MKSCFFKRMFINNSIFYNEAGRLMLKYEDFRLQELITVWKIPFLIKPEISIYKLIYYSVTPKSATSN